MLRCQTYQDGVRGKTESWQREKVRDMRRSEVNGKMCVEERAVFPRTFDAATSRHEPLKSARVNHVPEIFTIGFSDVFYTLSLDVGRVQERRLSDPSLT